MNASEIKPGQFITSTTTEQEFYPDLGGNILLYMVLVSGSVQVTATAEFEGDSPIIDSTYAIWSTAGDKIPIEVERNVRHLRIVGTGVVNVTY